MIDLAFVLLMILLILLVLVCLFWGKGLFRGPCGSYGSANIAEDPKILR